MMKATVADLRSAALVGLLFVLPLVILEVVNVAPGRESLPGLVVLFGLLWLLPAGILAVLMPLGRSLRSEGGIMGKPLIHLLGVVFVLVLALMWGSLLLDQFPCFMGVPNCD